jgi:NodT family efflux transporter outer membrane factor (OMF) lipoprotein
VVGAICASLCAGCAVLSPPSRDDARPETLPGSFSAADDGEPAADRWWERIGSPELNRLVETALTDNLDLAQAYARLTQARAVAVRAGAARWPDLAGSAGAARAEQRRQTDLGDFMSTEVDTVSLGLASSFELDFWGRTRSEHQAGRLDRDAAAEDLRTAAITLSAEVALRWLELLYERQTLDLLQEQLTANRRMLELMELRFRNAQANALDVLQQRDVLARTRALIPPVRRREQTLRHELALLLGRPPRDDPDVTTRTLPDPQPLPAVGIPLDLLARRPDLRAARLRLEAADWRVSVSQAARLPGLRLSGSAGYASEDWSTLLDFRVSRIAADLTAPLFEGGALTAEVERTRAVVEERLAAYHEAVLNAVREVEDALVAEARQGDLVQALLDRLESARQTYQESLARYRKGVSDFLPVLTAQLNQQETERSLVQAQRDRWVYRIQLHRALGGGWVDELGQDEGASAP